MDDLFLILAFLSLILAFLSIGAFFVGIVKPSVFIKLLKERATREGVAIIFGVATIVFFVLFRITTGLSSQTQPTTKNSVVSEEQEQPSEPAKQLSEKEQIQKLVSDQLKGTNNMKNPYVKKIDVIEQVGGGWGVFVEYNADDNLTKNLRKTGIEKKMSEIYIALYTSDKDIRSVSVAAYFPLVDQYGNKSSGVVYKSILEKGEVDKVNWGSDSSTLKLSILPGVWTTSILHPEFR